MYLVWLELEIKKKITLYATFRYAYGTKSQNSDDLGQTQILFQNKLHCFTHFCLKLSHHQAVS
jgi:hypothetical protein